MDVFSAASVINSVRLLIFFFLLFLIRTDWQVEIFVLKSEASFHWKSVIRDKGFRISVWLRESFRSRSRKQENFSSNSVSHTEPLTKVIGFTGNQKNLLETLANKNPPWFYYLNFFDDIRKQADQMEIKKNETELSRLPFY